MLGIQSSIDHRMSSTPYRTSSIEPAKMEDIRSLDSAANTGVQLPERGNELLATAYPVLCPSMVWPSTKHPELPFPFNHSSARYFDFARNATTALARPSILAEKEGH